MFLFQSPQHLSTDRLSDLSDLSDDSDWLGWMIGRVVKIKKTGNLMIFSLLGCPRKDSNLHVLRHTHLKRARLPFRHLGILRMQS